MPRRRSGEPSRRGHGSSRVPDRSRAALRPARPAPGPGPGRTPRQGATAGKTDAGPWSTPRPPGALEEGRADSRGVASPGGIVAVPPSRRSAERGTRDCWRREYGRAADVRAARRDGVRWCGGTAAHTAIRCTGFRPAPSHLAPLGPRGNRGRIATDGARAGRRTTAVPARLRRLDGPSLRRPHRHGTPGPGHRRARRQASRQLTSTVLDGTRALFLPPPRTRAAVQRPSATDRRSSTADIAATTDGATW